MISCKVFDISKWSGWYVLFIYRFGWEEDISLILSFVVGEVVVN